MHPLPSVFIPLTKSASIRLLKWAPANQKTFGIATSILEVPANLRIQNDPHQYFPWINKNQQMMSNVTKIWIDLKCKVVTRTQDRKSTWLWGSQTDEVRSLAADKIRRQRDKWW